MTKYIKFNWTNVRHLDLVGFGGEDLRVPGVLNVGNMVIVSVPGMFREVGEDEEVFKADSARDIWGRRWELQDLPIQ